MVVCPVETELGLDRDAVDTVGVKALLDLASQLHVLLSTSLRYRQSDLDVHGGHDLGVRQTPNMEVVAVDDAGQCHDVLPHVANIDVVRSSLQENLGRPKGERQGTLENDEGDEERNGRIGVVLVVPLRLPYYEGRCDYSHISKHIPYNVKDHSIHAHVAVIMTVRALGSIPRLVVVVVTVDARVTPAST